MHARRATRFSLNLRPVPTSKGKLFKNLPVEGPEEFFQTLHQQPGLKIERILSNGHTTPKGEWYNQDWDEWVLVVRGKGIIRFPDDSEETLEKGDYLFIPSHKKHRVIFTDPQTLWLAVHCGDGVSEPANDPGSLS
ncbi:MAG: cupin domain-containing protein [Verrucomicrobiae bacterium]|nr:cupin domain-containing protein [Verrucomicrobiae bacterium]